MELPRQPEPSRDEPPGLKPPQFRLRTLLITIAVLALLLAAARRTEPVVWAIGLFAMVSILAHVAGNAIGTQLRRRNGSRFLEPAPSAAERPPPSPPNQLHLRESLGRPIQILTILGGLGGAIGGCTWIWARYGGQAELAAFLVASAGFGGLGAFFTFLAVGFFQTIGHAIHQAHEAGDARWKK